MIQICPLTLIVGCTHSYWDPPEHFSSSRTVYKLLATIVDSNPTDFFTFKNLRFFYFKIVHLFIGVMLKTEIFDILLHGEISVGEVAV